MLSLILASTALALSIITLGIVLFDREIKKPRIVSLTRESGGLPQDIPTVHLNQATMRRESNNNKLETENNEGN